MPPLRFSTDCAACYRFFRAVPIAKYILCLVHLVLSQPADKMASFKDLSTAEGVKQLDEYLLTRSYISGYCLMFSSAADSRHCLLMSPVLAATDRTSSIVLCLLTFAALIAQIPGFTGRSGRVLSAQQGT